MSLVGHRTCQSARDVSRLSRDNIEKYPRYRKIAFTHKFTGAKMSQRLIHKMYTFKKKSDECFSFFFLHMSSSSQKTAAGDDFQ